MKTVTLRSTLAPLLIAILTAACGGGDDSGDGGGGGDENFTPATEVSDICGMLTLTDVQGVLPDATAGAEQPTGDTTDAGFWARDCKWDSSSSFTSVELVIFGALTQAGLDGIKIAAKSGTVNQPVSGLGDEAHYWEDGDFGTNGLWALQAPYSVDVTAYFIEPFPTADQFEPLVEKALGQLN